MNTTAGKKSAATLLAGAAAFMVAMSMGAMEATAAPKAAQQIVVNPKEENILPQVAKVYTDAINKAAEKYGVNPKILKGVVKVESGFDATATSSSGAAGPAQFVPAMWDKYGKDLNGDGKADPMSINESIDALARLMADYRDKVEEIDGCEGREDECAVQAYNAGVANVKKYNGDVKFKETQKYVAKVLKVQ